MYPAEMGENKISLYENVCTHRVKGILGVKDTQNKRFIKIHVHWKDLGLQSTYAWSIRRQSKCMHLNKEVKRQSSRYSDDFTFFKGEFEGGII